MANKKLTQEANPIWYGQPKDYTGAALATKWVSLKNYSRIAFEILLGAWAGGTAAVTLQQAQAIAGTGAKALAFTEYTLKTAADDKGTVVAVTGNTFDLDTTFATDFVIIEVNAIDLDQANGFDVVRLAIASPGVNADVYGVGAHLYGARYLEATPPSALVD